MAMMKAMNGSTYSKMISSTDWLTEIVKVASACKYPVSTPQTLATKIQVPSELVYNLGLLTQ